MAKVHPYYLLISMNDSTVEKSVLDCRRCSVIPVDRCTVWNAVVSWSLANEKWIIYVRVYYMKRKWFMFDVLCMQTNTTHGNPRMLVKKNAWKIMEWNVQSSNRKNCGGGVDGHGGIGITQQQKNGHNIIIIKPFYHFNSDKAFASASIRKLQYIDSMRDVFELAAREIICIFFVHTKCISPVWLAQVRWPYRPFNSRTELKSWRHTSTPFNSVSLNRNTKPYERCAKGMRVQHQSRFQRMLLEKRTAI